MSTNSSFSLSDHKPGETSTHHTHLGNIKRTSLERSIVFVDGEKYPIKEGDFVLIPPDADHYFENTGSSILSE